MNKLFTIVYEDDEIICVNKKANVLSIPDRSLTAGKDVFSFLKDMYGEIFIVHRLDRETSGLLCFAKNEITHRQLCRLFEGRSIEKKYLALVTGVPADMNGEVKLAIKSHPSRPNTMLVSHDGKPSATKFRVIEIYGNISLLEVIPLTGRTHQIRIHLSSIGHPLLGDTLYGHNSAFYLSAVKRGYVLGKNQSEKPLLNRTALHAYSLAFQLPSQDELIRIIAPLAKDMKAVMNQLGKVFHKRTHIF